MSEESQDSKTQLSPFKQWIAALRSGEYKQSKNGLAIIAPDGSKSYCCLGVACDLYAKAFPSKVRINENAYRSDKGQGCSYNGETAYLPMEVLHWLNVKGMKYTGRVVIDGMHENVVSMNDQEGKTFIEIADFLEATVKENV